MSLTTKILFMTREMLKVLLTLKAMISPMEDLTGLGAYYFINRLELDRKQTFQSIAALQRKLQFHLTGAMFAPVGLQQKNKSHF
tara:strand:- start:1070 stop:1321 length:252 start_codon:yes stop_codon:yes gene_type:complete